jgi:regulator of sigma E protease
VNLGAAVLDVLRTGVLLLITLTVLVAVHELGHFLVAKWCGMEVEAFAVMMGGIRKTDLSQYLNKPLTPKIWVWMAAVAAFGVWLLGVGIGIEWLALAGLAILTFIVPAWIGMRLEALYHLPRFEALRKFGMCWMGGLVLIAFGTRLQGLNPSLILGVLLGGSLLALLMIYYHPVTNKEEDTPQGQGSIDLPVRDPETSIDQKVTVWFRPVWFCTSKGGTEFSLLALPLGGFARIKGMEPKADGSEVSIENGFYSKNAVKRLAVLFAGPLFSILFGILLLGVCFSAYGMEKPSEAPVIGIIDLKAAGAKAGLKMGDRIVSVDGVKVAKFTDIGDQLRDNVVTKADGTMVGKPTVIEFERDGKASTINVVPDVDQIPSPLFDLEGNPTGEEMRQARLLIKPKMDHLVLSVSEAFSEAAEFPINAATQMVSMFTNVGKAKQMVGGPVTTAQVASASATGPNTALLFAGLLSISLGVMNLLPFPPLDGGQMVVAFVELFRRGRRLSTKMQQALQTAGFCAILALMATAFIVDIGRQSAPAEPARDWSTTDEKAK